MVSSLRLRYFALFLGVGLYSATAAVLSTAFSPVVQVLVVLSAAALAAGAGLWLVSCFVLRSLSQLAEQLADLQSASAPLPAAERADVIGAVARSAQQAVRRQEDHFRAVVSAFGAANVEDRLDRLLEAVQSITGAHYAALSILSPDGRLDAFRTRGLPEDVQQEIEDLPREEGLLGCVQTSGETVRLEERAAYPASVGFPDGYPPVESLLATPIQYDGTTLGTLYLSDRKEGDNTFSEENEAVVEQLAQLAAVIVGSERNAQAHHRLREQLEGETRTLGKKLERLAQGDLSVTIGEEEEEADGVLSDLKRDLAQTIDHLRHLIRQISDAACSTNSTSGQIQVLIDQLADGVEEQNAQADEVAAAVEEMAQTVLSTSENAQQTAGRAAASRDAAEKGESIIGQAVHKVEEIAQVVETSATTIEELGASSQEIGQIAATIDEIADQTNLLALNAAIEAAHAGEHGKGFAVVADEVRQLAERTTAATQEIAAMITQIQGKTDQAVTAMRDGTDEVEEGLRLASEARSALSEIVGSTREAEEKVVEIAAASEQQSATSEQLSRSVAAISEGSSSSGRDVFEIAEHIEALGEQAHTLQTLVDQFQLADAAGLPHGDSGGPAHALPTLASRAAAPAGEAPPSVRLSRSKPPAVPSGCPVQP